MFPRPSPVRNAVTRRTRGRWEVGERLSGASLIMRGLSPNLQKGRETFPTFPIPLTDLGFFGGTCRGRLTIRDTTFPGWCGVANPNRLFCADASDEAQTKFPAFVRGSKGPKPGVVRLHAPKAQAVRPPGLALSRAQLWHCLSGAGAWHMARHGDCDFILSHSIAAVWPDEAGGCRGRDRLP
jgi:hypothetical protein